ncbi:MAG: Mur ligase family protein [Patescibacteria group bacterium]|jgi:UDP-N-acetylmuramoyl-tripeptide--D-alanyl-D-alanine ligase|nr:Mur ligase family protein [Patescibacteria group bacterium]
MKKILKFFVQHYLRILAKIVLWRHKPMIVAISGTTNKTFIKELILKEVGDDMKVRGNPKSFNTEIGLPLAVLFLPSGYSSAFKWMDVLFEGTITSLFSSNFPKVLILEMGVDCKGDMGYLLSIIRPNIAIITNIDRNFPDNKTSVNDIATEMKQLVESIDKQGLVFLNGDSSIIKNLANYSEAEVLTWGLCDDCTIKISDVKDIDSGQKFILNYQEKQETIEINKFGYHNVSAFAVAKIASRENLKRKK